MSVECGGRDVTVGLFFLAGDSWWEMGACTAESGRYKGFIDKVDGLVCNIIAEMRKSYNIVTSGIVHTDEAAVAEARLFNEMNVDAIIYCPIIWTNDQPLVSFLKTIHRVPILLWSYDPYGKILDYYRITDWLLASAPVSVQQSTGIFRRYGWYYSYCFGNEKQVETLAQISSFVRSAATMKSLRGTRIAVIPAPCRLVKGTWFDEMELLSRFGVEVKYLSVQELVAAVGSVSEAEAGQWMEFYSRFPSREVSREQLLASVRQATGLVKLVETYGLSGVALEDFAPEFNQTFGYRPHLYHPVLGERCCTVGLEADVLGVLATIIVGRLSGAVGMFSEFFTIDATRNQILLGHPGYGEISFADEETTELTPDIEIDDGQPRGVWLSYRAKAGLMSFLNLSPDEIGIRGACFTAECQGGARVMEGYAHMIVRPGAGAGHIFSKVNSYALFQHWGAAYGTLTSGISTLFELLDVPLRDLDSQ